MHFICIKQFYVHVKYMEICSVAYTNPALFLAAAAPKGFNKLKKGSSLKTLDSKPGSFIAVLVTLNVLVTTIDALRHFKQDNYSTVGGDGGCRVSEVRAGTTSPPPPMPDHKGFKLQ